MKVYFASILLLLFVTNSSAIDIQNGKELFKEAACMDCHTDIDFHRDAKKTNSFKKLHSLVQACQYSNDVAWFDDEAGDVTQFLNQKYYKFKNTALEK